MCPSLSSNALLIENWQQSTAILDGKTRLSIVDDQAYRGIGSDKPKNIFETLRRDCSLKSKLQSLIGAVLPGKFFALWNPEPTKLRAYICDEEPIDDIEYFDSPKAKMFFEKVTVQGGIQTLQAIRLDDFGIENAGF
ncbi:MAG: hypothetical protein ACK5CA_16395 [Cyanobacteriota bacterium]|jgi:hypothetical protein